MSAMCQQGRYRKANVTAAEMDLRKVAWRSSRPGVAGERAQRQIPGAKADLAKLRDALASHLDFCTECAVEVSR